MVPTQNPRDPAKVPSVPRRTLVAWRWRASFLDVNGIRTMAWIGVWEALVRCWNAWSYYLDGKARLIFQGCSFSMCFMRIADTWEAKMVPSQPGIIVHHISFCFHHIHSYSGIFMCIPQHSRHAKNMIFCGWYMICAKLLCGPAKQSTRLVPSARAKGSCRWPTSQLPAPQLHDIC